jgi:hypothetical protein
MMLHDIREWIRSQPDGCVSINYVVEESKRGWLAGISLQKSSLRQVLRETFGAAVVERSVSNTKLLKPTFFELFPQFFEVTSKSIRARAQWPEHHESATTQARPVRPRAPSEADSSDSFHTVSSTPCPRQSEGSASGQDPPTLTRAEERRAEKERRKEEQERNIQRRRQEWLDAQAERARWKEARTVQDIEREQAAALAADVVGDDLPEEDEDDDASQKPEEHPEKEAVEPLRTPSPTDEATRLPISPDSAKAVMTPPSSPMKAANMSPTPTATPTTRFLQTDTTPSSQGSGLTPQLYPVERRLPFPGADLSDFSLPAAREAASAASWRSYNWKLDFWSRRAGVTQAAWNEQQRWRESNWKEAWTRNSEWSREWRDARSTVPANGTNTNTTAAQVITLADGSVVQMQYISTLNAAVAAVDHLRSASILAIDCEGVNLSATGELTLVQVAFAMNGLFVYIFDAVALGMGLRVLHRILQEPHPVKLFHDLRNDAAALHRQFGISIRGALDTQVAYMMSERQFESIANGSLPVTIGLNAFLRWCNVPLNDQKDGMQITMANDDQVWKRRPLSATLLRYAVQDAALLLVAWSHLRHALTPAQVDMCVSITEQRAGVACGILAPSPPLYKY